MGVPVCGYLRCWVYDLVCLVWIGICFRGVGVVALACSGNGVSGNVVNSVVYSFSFM